MTESVASVRPTRGLDLVKRMPREWSDKQLWAEMVRHYDWLLEEYLALGGDPANPRLFKPPYAFPPVIDSCPPYANPTS